VNKLFKYYFPVILSTPMLYNYYKFASQAKLPPPPGQMFLNKEKDFAVWIPDPLEEGETNPEKSGFNLLGSNSPQLAA